MSKDDKCPKCGCYGWFTDSPNGRSCTCNQCCGTGLTDVGDLRNQLAQRDKELAQFEDLIECDNCHGLYHKKNLTQDGEQQFCRWCVELDEARKENKRLREVMNKVALCFPVTIPENLEEVSFNIPAYIIEELRVATKGGG